MFKLKTELIPKGDQPRAIKEIIEKLKNKEKEQVLLGATGTGKTFTMANVINNFQKSTLILVHNKTLAMQIYQEMQSFFPENKVEYYVSYFDYYRPEAYKPSSDLYIGKKVQRNLDISKMRLRTLNSLATDEHVIVVSSIAAIYGCFNPNSYKRAIICLNLSDYFNVEEIEKKLFLLGYKKNEKRVSGSYFIKDKILSFSLAWEDEYHFEIEYNEENFISSIKKVSNNGDLIRKISKVFLPPSQDYVGEEGEKLSEILIKIEKETEERIEQLKEEKKFSEAERLYSKVKEDLLDLKELGYCQGIENYSRYFDGRKEGETPFVLLDYFPKDYLLIVDESHITTPQIKAMYNTNLSRVKSLVDYGFRLPSALDNRPLNLEEFFKKTNFLIYVSATPSEFELERTNYSITEQIIRPTGLIDPEIEIRESVNQISDIIEEIEKKIKKNEKVLIYALTIKMSEEISEYLQEQNIKVVYLHSKMEIFERYQAINSLRRGIYDVIVGINLLKEGIDLPEVSLVCILDADKSGFLRDSRSLIQIIGRASRNVNGQVILYADEITKDMKKAMDETERRRQIQTVHNEINSVIPKTIKKAIKDVVIDSEISSLIERARRKEMSQKEMKKLLKKIERTMKNLAKQFKFDQAISLRNAFIDLKSFIEPQ